MDEGYFLFRITRSLEISTRRVFDGAVNTGVVKVEFTKFEFFLDLVTLDIGPAYVAIWRVFYDLEQVY